MKATKPFWDLERVRLLAADDRMVLSRTRALNFFDADETAVATAKHIIAGLSDNSFAETLLQPAKCGVYGVQMTGAGWYLKLTIDPRPTGRAHRHLAASAGETAENEYGNGETMKCYTCFEGEVVLKAEPGRTTRYKTIPNLPIPADLEMRTCDH